MRRILGAVAVTALVAAALPAQAHAADHQTQAAGSAVRSGIAGETTSVSGTFSRKDARRAVQLQLQAGRSWRTVAKGRTTSKGAYRLTLRVPAKTAKYRVVAPKARKNGRTLPARRSGVGTVRPVAQQVRFSFDTNVTSGGVLRAVVRTSPHRAGRPISIQVSNGGAWRTLKTVAAPARGNTSITAKAPAMGQWNLRAVAGSFRGAAAAGSPVSRMTVAPGASDVIAYEVVALGSKTIERGVQSDTTCGEISSEVTRQTTSSRPTADSPRVWREGLAFNGNREVDIYPDVSSTYVDHLEGCESAAPPADVQPCEMDVDDSAQHPTDRITVNVRIAKGASTGEVVFFPPRGKNLGYPGAWDSRCRVKELQDNSQQIPLSSRTVKVPVATLLGTKPFKVSTEGLFKNEFERDGVTTSKSGSWVQSITLHRVASR
ncbi:hypothetical protein [Aeromicrobium sp. IC_218]|uniref:hypothetical protein n=1 Tax=Aeromicrobium sp. IC_218 TaxID=2545468 RepID=UPI0010394E28|nr:hypothetical protein [Aeromicrobium sp. IC_218]TCJ00758.1 hypothetical protein E0W78_01345 [Aeromicrobium sp. IC_218]